jgi:hypothetical protein
MYVTGNPTSNTDPTGYLTCAFVQIGTCENTTGGQATPSAVTDANHEATQMPGVHGGTGWGAGPNFSGGASGSNADELWNAANEEDAAVSDATGYQQRQDEINQPCPEKTPACKDIDGTPTAEDTAPTSDEELDAFCPFSAGACRPHHGMDDAGFGTILPEGDIHPENAEATVGASLIALTAVTASLTADAALLYCAAHPYLCLHSIGMGLGIISAPGAPESAAVGPVAQEAAAAKAAAPAAAKAAAPSVTKVPVKDLRQISDSMLKKVLKGYGTDPHSFKADFVPGNVSKFDVKLGGDGALYLVSKDGRVIIPTGHTFSGGE